MSTTTSFIPRRHHAELHPLVTSHDLASTHVGQGSSIPSSILTNTSTLPSPSIVAARAYFLEQSPPIGQNIDALQRRRSLIEAQEFPRRHSALPAQVGLAMKVASSVTSWSNQNLDVVRETTESASNLRTAQGEDADNQNDMINESTLATKKRHDAGTGTISAFLQQVPFQYTHDRLRNWGFAYLGNTATADAFINAISLRRPSLQLGKEDDAGDRPKLAGMVTIRARVLPRAKERKPFVIQRKFDIEELRVSIPAIQKPASTPLRRSIRARRSSAQISITSPRRTTAETIGENVTLLGKGAVPIHIEYALHYLPVLAALMLSGHVRKGDSIDLPLPHPETWRDVVLYIYTGKGEMTTGVKENILYLAGNAG